MNSTGPFTTLRRELAPMTWPAIVALVSDHARHQGIRWDDAARELATATQETPQATGGTR